LQYGLRARAYTRPSRARTAALDGEEAKQPGALATIAAGLKIGVMTKAELLRFAGNQAEYLSAR
jgi:hypothetical protein